MTMLHLLIHLRSQCSAQSQIFLMNVEGPKMMKKTELCLSASTTGVSFAQKVLSVGLIVSEHVK